MAPYVSSTKDLIMDEEKVVKTNKADFKLFKNEVEEWIKAFGLNDWEIEFAHEDLECARAQCNWCIEHKIAQMTLSTDWTGAEYNPRQICLAAFHETVELLLAELADMANKIVSEDEVNARVHSLIHRLQRVVFKPKSKIAS